MLKKIGIKKRAIVCVTNDLVTDQRVHKTCLTLQKCSYDVLATGRLLPKSLPFVQPYKTRRVKHFFNRKALFYAEYNIRLFFFLLFAKVDLIFANDLDTLPAALWAAKIRKKRLIFDAHELFFEMPELQHRNFQKKIWKKIEDIFIPKLDSAITVCQSIADYYKEKYHIDFKAVRNMPLYKFDNSEKEKLNFGDKKIIIYQGAINVGRGLEWTIEAMKYVENAVLLIIGNGDIEEKLKQQVSDLQLDNKVFFLGKIVPEKLPAYTVNANIGLCLLENRGLSYYYSLPNRVFDYIQAKVPVLATDFPEISNIVNTYHTGITINNYEPQFLAKKINEMLENKIDNKVFEKAAKELCWENEEKILIEIINS